MANNLLVPIDQYLSVGIHIGTRYKTKDTKPFIFKVRQDGIAVFNVEEINKRLIMAANFLAKYDPEDILVVCRRENGWEAVKAFSKITGIKAITGRYPPGILTNPNLDNFIEVKLLFVVDPWPDRNAIHDAAKVGIPVLALVDTNNDLKNIDVAVPCNNKGKKSLGLIFWILTREYLLRRGVIKSAEEFKYKFEDFCKD